MDHQVVNRVVREDRAHGDGGFWALADGTTIPVARAQQAIAGLNVSHDGVSFDLSGFYKLLDDLTLFAPRLYTGIAPAPDADLLHTGSGTASGIEAVLPYRVPQNVMWMGYTLSRVDNSFPTLEDDTFAASYDQLHEFKVVDTYEILARWSVRGAFVVGSGRPVPRPRPASRPCGFRPELSSPSSSSATRTHHACPRIIAWTCRPSAPSPSPGSGCRSGRRSSMCTIRRAWSRSSTTTTSRAR